MIVNICIRGLSIANLTLKWAGVAKLHYILQYMGSLRAQLPTPGDCDRHRQCTSYKQLVRHNIQNKVCLYHWAKYP